MYALGLVLMKFFFKSINQRKLSSINRIKQLL